MPFADLLQFLNANKSTGTLQVRKGHEVKMIFFENGRIVSASSTDPREYLGHFLVSHGYINEQELRMAMEIQRNSKMLLGKVLVMGGKITEAEMAQILTLKCAETVYSLFLLDEGEFLFFHDDSINKLFVRISLDPQSLIFEGVLRKDEWQRIRQVFPHNNVVVEKVIGVRLPAEELDAHTRKTYSAVDGKSTIDDLVLSLHSVDYLVCRSLFELYSMGAIRITKVLDPPVVRRAFGGDYSHTQLLHLAREELARNRYEEALDLLRAIDPGVEGYQKEILPLVTKTESEITVDIYHHVISPHAILQLKVPLDQLAGIQLSPEEGFVLSRVDGMWDVRSIVSITPMKEVDTLRLIKKLIERGIVGAKS